MCNAYAEAMPDVYTKPFEHLIFLVRDWEDDEILGDRPEFFPDLVRY